MQKIKNICISTERGPKKEVDEIILIAGSGIKGDIHAAPGSLRQVSFLTEAMINTVIESGLDVKPGDFGENFIITDIDVNEIETGKMIKIGENVVIEITLIGKECKKPCQIFYKMGRCIMPETGIFGKVINGGRIKVGDCYTYGQ